METSFISQALAPPLAIKAPLLLVEFCPANAPDARNQPAPQRLTLNAIKLAAALEEIVPPSIWCHGGLNE